MKAVSRLLCGIALAALPCTSALADTFTFTFTGSQFDGSTTLTTSSAVGNQYTIQSAAGSIDGSSSIKLLSAGSFGGNDNILYDPGFYDNNFLYGTQGPFNFDSYGASFQLESSTGRNLGDVNIYQDANGFFDLHYFEAATLDPTGRGQDMTEVIQNIDVVNTTPSAVPEPGSLALFSTGILGLAGLVRRKLTA